ncbi:hypothetical protein CERSUDRAFT_82375 [Gelatoporia subvermispora B]|uniref:Uncharacterized protein n=1 Tax=Ceriporiopsis subvermispora (strain B) TaxID=914234 RepID=M2QM65_CERS8|nr:hypothetical protein CERSUDRAFT_82375 [Gelatoporia subvermispora B]
MAGAPSQFAALLRRSKFASFDPEIAQVYTSHNGNVHRGNWGFKRPLALRRRNAYITMKTVDSSEQQTEWERGESQARWIKMWDEIGVSAELKIGRWQSTLGDSSEAPWDIDSEFGSSPFPQVVRVRAGSSSLLDGADEPTAFHQETRRSESGATGSFETMAVEGMEEDAEEALEGLGEGVLLLQRWQGESRAADSKAVENIESMTDSEFERYLEKLRRYRPEFKEFTDKVSRRKDSVQNAKDSITQQQLKVEEFLRLKAEESYTNPQTRAVEQRPQTIGGLTYSQIPKLQSLLLQKAQPGRIVQNRFLRGTEQDYVVNFAGMGTQLNKNLGDSTTRPINFERMAATGTRDPDEGNIKLKVLKAQLADAPKTVDKDPQALDGVSIIVSVTDAARIGEKNDNPYPPGSREYVGFQPALLSAPSSSPSPTSLFNKSRKPKQPTEPQEQAEPEELMMTLRDIVKSEGQDR